MARKKAEAQPEEKKPWTITQEDIDSITDQEVVRKTMRLLPPEDEIPAEFWKGNIYTRIAEAMHFNDPIPAGEVSFNPGFRQDPIALQRLVLAHILCIDPTYEHKTAGVGYIISKILHVTAILT